MTIHHYVLQTIILICIPCRINKARLTDSTVKVTHSDDVARADSVAR